MTSYKCSICTNISESSSVPKFCFACGTEYGEWLNLTNNNTEIKKKAAIEIPKVEVASSVSTHIPMSAPPLPHSPKAVEPTPTYPTPKPKPVKPAPVSGLATIDPPKKKSHIWKFVVILVLLIVLYNRGYLKFLSFSSKDTTLKQTEIESKALYILNIENFLTPLWIGKIGNESVSLKFTSIHDGKISGYSTYKKMNHPFTGAILVKNNSCLIQVQETGSSGNTNSIELSNDPSSGGLSGSFISKDKKKREYVVLQMLSNK